MDRRTRPKVRSSCRAEPSTQSGPQAGRLQEQVPGKMHSHSVEGAVQGPVVQSIFLVSKACVASREPQTVPVVNRESSHVHWAVAGLGEGATFLDGSVEAEGSQENQVCDEVQTPNQLSVWCRVRAEDDLTPRRVHREQPVRCSPFVWPSKRATPTTL